MVRGKPKPRVLVVAGAKGGVGTSLIASNMAVHLATLGRRVVLVDADPSGGDLHAFVGAERPGGVPRMRFRTKRAPELDDGSPRTVPTVSSIDTSPSGEPVPTVVPSLHLVRSGVDTPQRGKTRRASIREALSRAKKLDCDEVVVDLGNATSDAIAASWSSADRALFVVTPEPSAFESMYRFVRQVFASVVRGAVAEDDLSQVLDAVLRRSGGAPAPLDLIEVVQRESPELARQLRRCAETFSFSFVVNRTSMRSDLELGRSAETAARRRYGVGLECRGSVEDDTAVSFAVRRRRPLLLESPGAKSSRAIEKIARRYLTKETRGQSTRRPSVPPSSYHGLLDVERAASDEEIRRAYKRMCGVFEPDSVVTFGLFDADDLELVRKHLDEAHDVLLDPQRRAVYEEDLFPPVRSALLTTPVPKRRSGPLPPAPELSSETMFTGALIRAVRQSQGVGLREISDRTKVGTSHLASIESEDYESLPPAVYVRGFVSEVAKFLKLDPEQVSRSYVERYRSYLEARGRGA